MTAGEPSSSTPANGSSRLNADAASPPEWTCLGVLAGGGALPITIAEGARAAGKGVFLLGLKGWADPTDLARFDHDWVGVGEVGKMFRRLRDHGCDAVAFAGVVRRPDFASLKVDWRGARELPKLAAAAGRGDDALLRCVVRLFEGEGLMVLGAGDVARQLTAPDGPIGAHAAGDAHQGDIALAFDVARALGAFDVGQGAVACDGLVLALEAQEGTDAMLRRVRDLPEAIRGTPQARRGVLVKVAKPNQERRVDLPTVGVATVEGAAAAGLAGIVVEAGGALIVDRDAVAAAADAAGLFVQGARPAAATSSAADV